MITVVQGSSSGYRFRKTSRFSDLKNDEKTMQKVVVPPPTIDNIAIKGLIQTTQNRQNLNNFLRRELDIQTLKSMKRSSSSSSSSDETYKRKSHDKKRSNNKRSYNSRSSSSDSREYSGDRRNGRRKSKR